MGVGWLVGVQHQRRWSGRVFHTQVGGGGIRDMQYIYIWGHCGGHVSLTGSAPLLIISTLMCLCFTTFGPNLKSMYKRVYSAAFFVWSSDFETPLSTDCEFVVSHPTCVWVRVFLRKVIYRGVS